jgi:tetratricopeptide (TPR) repeat protein
MSGLGFLLIFSGDATGAEATLAQSLALARAADDPWETARALLGLGIGATYQGDYDRGEAFGGEALALYRRLAETDVRARAWVGGVLNDLGVAAYARGELALASARLEEALRWEREVGFTWYAGLTLVNLGNVARDRGEPGSALAYYAEALALGTAHRDKRIVARALEGAAGLAVMRGQAERAGRLYGAAAALREEVGILVDTPSRPAWERGMAAARAALGEAAFAAALKVGRTLSPDQVSAELTALATDVEVARASETGGEAADAGLSPRE